MDPIVVHEGDDLPDIFIRLKDDANDCWIDLSGATTVITAKFREKNTATVLQTITCTKEQGGLDGQVKMVWPATALDVDFGNYEIEISISFNGSIQTVNTYYRRGATADTAKTLPIKVREEF